MTQTNDDHSTPQPASRLCIHCHSDQIKPGAGTCPECGKSQGRFWPKVQFVSFIIGFLSVTLSAIAFLQEQIATTFVRLTRGDDIYFVSLQSGGQSTLYNNGYRPLIVLRAEFDVADLNFNDNINLYTTVTPGELAKTGTTAPLSRSISFSTDTDQKLLEMHPDLFHAEATMNSDPDFMRARQASDRTTGFPCTGTLYFQPVGTSEESKHFFDCTGIITFDNTKVSRAQYLGMYLLQNASR